MCRWRVSVSLVEWWALSEVQVQGGGRAAPYGLRFAHIPPRNVAPNNPNNPPVVSFPPSALAPYSSLRSQRGPGHPARAVLVRDGAGHATAAAALEEGSGSGPQRNARVHRCVDETLGHTAGPVAASFGSPSRGRSCAVHHLCCPPPPCIDVPLPLPLNPAPSTAYPRPPTDVRQRWPPPPRCTAPWRRGSSAAPGPYPRPTSAQPATPPPRSP